jgi:hypothetical protein
MIRIGDDVEWKWGASTAQGRVVERFEERVTIEIKGKPITRNATREEPAFLIEQDDGDQVLKSGSELSPRE